MTSTFECSKKWGDYPVASMAQPSSDFQHCKLLQYAI